jgi:hypothetical protein
VCETCVVIVVIRLLSHQRDLDRSPGAILQVGDLDRERPQLPGFMPIPIGDQDRDLPQVVGPGTRMVRGLRFHDRLDS